MKRIFKWVFAAFILLIGTLAFNTLRYTPKTTNITEAPSINVDVDAVANLLSQAIQFKTTSTSSFTTSSSEDFKGFVDWLHQSFPSATGTMERTLINDLTPLYLWKGQDRALNPILMTGHYDVVPIENSNEWTHPPFSGAIADGYIWGRGTLDDKGAIVAMMHTVEMLTQQGFIPARDIYFSFGHDEEVGGRRGAKAVVEYLQSNNIEIEWSLDEGSMVLRDIIPGLNKDIASINVAEKGYLTVEITASAQGGHSSLPPQATAVGTLAHAVSNLQSNPVPGGLKDTSKDFFDALGANFSLIKRVLFANQWLFRPLLEKELSKSAATNAMLRTSMAPTMLSGSIKENVLPQQATATINYRLHPRDTVEDVLNHTNKYAGGENITVKIKGEAKPSSPVSSSDNKAFSLLSKTFSEIFGEIIIVPGLTIAATDTVHYSKIAKDSYRINPFIFSGEDIPRIHGLNERISLDNMKIAVQFYTQMIKNLDAK